MHLCNATRMVVLILIRALGIKTSEITALMVLHKERHREAGDLKRLPFEKNYHYQLCVRLFRTLEKMNLRSFILHLALSIILCSRSANHSYKIIGQVFPLPIHPMSDKFANHFFLLIYPRNYKRLFHLTLSNNHDYLIRSTVLFLDVDNHGSPQLPSFSLNNVAFLTTCIVLVLLSIWKTSAFF